MTFAALREAVRALCGGSDFQPLWALAPAVNRALARIARRCPEEGTLEIEKPRVRILLRGRTTLSAQRSFDVLAGGVSFRFYGAGTVSDGQTSARLLSGMPVPFRFLHGNGTLTFTPDEGAQLILFDLLFTDAAPTAAALPLFDRGYYRYNASALAEGLSEICAVESPGFFTGGEVILPERVTFGVRVRYSKQPGRVTVEELNAGTGNVPVPAYAEDLLPLGVAADLFAGEDDLPVSFFETRFREELEKLPRRCVYASPVFDRKGWT